MEFAPITGRSEWADIIPLRPAPLQHPVVDIAEDPDHGDVMAYFWSGMQAGEVSERMLKLSEEIIVALNSAHYSVWEWRWRCIQALGGINVHAHEERRLMQLIATENPKNYQLWNYRRKFALALGPDQGPEEMEFSAACLTFDPKNYHSWAHRQAIISAFGGNLWPKELQYTETLLDGDVRNNSAWNQRAFILTQGPEGSPLPSHIERYSSEHSYIATKLALAVNNESVWSHLGGLVTWPGAPAAALAVDSRFEHLCIETLKEHSSCIPALRLLAEVYREKAGVLYSAGKAVEGGKAVEVAREVLEKLKVADPVRKKFYGYKQRQLGLLLGKGK